MSESIAAIIVIYNRELRESITYSHILEIKNVHIHLYVMDNSEIETSNCQFCKRNNIQYCSMNGNKGLSKAYNMALNICKEDVIILLDDDTEITQEYFNVLQQALQEHSETDIFAPIVYGQDGVIYSPNEFHFLRNHFMKTEKDEIDQNKFNAIASCLAIRRRVFKDYRFNESLFVDQVDQNFFCEQRQRGMRFMKLDTVIHQNFYQRGTVLLPEIGWNRLKLRIVDVMQHAKLLKKIRYRILALIKCCGLGLQIARKSKSPEIIIKSFKLSIKMLIAN